MKRFYASFNMSTKLGGHCLMIDVAIGAKPDERTIVHAYMEKHFKGLWANIYSQPEASMNVINVEPERLFYSDAAHL